MNYFEHPEFSAHEHVSFIHDAATGLKAIIAIHSLRGGFCGGGIRFFPYADSSEALYDVLRLSKGMSYKAALAGLPFGGGKSVIIGDPRTHKSGRLLEAFGRAVDRLGGKYVCAEDMGVTPDDMLDIRKATPWVTGLPGKSGDTSPLTGFGVYRALQAAALRRLGRPLASVAILGFGNVGRHLARHLAADGVRLVVADVNADNVRRAVAEYGAMAVTVDELFAADVDAIAPCSIGAVLNERTVALIRAPIVCGGANNQLERPERDGAALDSRGVLYVPDYIANAGGVISGSAEILGRAQADTTRMVAGIYDTCMHVFQIADERRCSPLQAAETLAERILQERPSSH